MLKSVIKGFLFFVICLSLFAYGLNKLIPKSDSLLTKKDFLEQRERPFTYLALGDSLTAGVGDTTNQGGFVPLLSQHLEQTYPYQVTSHNYGISGNTSKQILKRMREDESLKDVLSNADLMTLTVGGNDVLAVIRKNLPDLSLSDFAKSSIDYQERLRQIISLSRQENPQLPIYILGIYNPFYLNFPEIRDMQSVIDNWNKATEAITKEYVNVYFVPINDLLYKGLDGQDGQVQTFGDQTRVINDALFTEDHFHPNNLGYQIMANAVMEVIRGTKESW